MKKQSVLFSIAVAVLLFCSMQTIQAGTITNVLKKTTGVVLGSVALGTAFELGIDLSGRNLNNITLLVHNRLGLYTISLFMPIALSRLLKDRIKSTNYSIVARLALLAATGYGSYELLKSSVDKQEVQEEDEYEYSS